MKLTAVVLTTFALGPAIVLAWAKDGSTGAWVANNKWYQWDGVGGYSWVHESCTTMNSHKTHEGGYCAFWTDSRGTKKKGHCNKNSKNELECKPGCKDIWDMCSISRDDGDCDRGYSACLEKVGCENRPGEADCIGVSVCE